MFPNSFVFFSTWVLEIVTKTLDDKSFAPRGGMRLSHEPKPLAISYCSESETHPHAVTFTFCRMVTRVIPLKTSSLSGMYQSDKSDGLSLMALFSFLLSCFFPCSRWNNNVCNSETRLKKLRDAKLLKKNDKKWEIFPNLKNFLVSGKEMFKDSMPHFASFSFTLTN